MVPTRSTEARVLLVANRGEIARRVLRTARAEGWRTVAIHSDLDREALHVAEADAAVRVASYLDIDEVVAAATTSGATHVHPGYGFLSERAAFARAVEASGLTLVGPSASVMETMGRKDAAREVATAAGVPTVPAYDLDTDPAELTYPVLVKAAAGGGGKGMRIVRAGNELSDAKAAAAREAAAAFGDDALLVETYVERGRHIEVQILADTHGRVVHLFERDCSTQRRHQKVLEEAPAPTLTADQRRRVTEAAVALAREAGYVNAGTVEFLLDDATGAAYFLEMNTRLQVEHPVTEMVVRIGESSDPLDLVALQLRVAEGKPLGFDQAEVRLDGHAIEARVYAEDSFGGFLPQAGTATVVRWGGFEALAPPGLADARLPGVRVDHALVPNQVVSTAYDPMLGKVIAHGADREEARSRLIAALDETAILGLTTNTGFVRALAATDEFRDAMIDTAWLDRHEVPSPDADVPRVVAAWADVLVTRRGAPPGPFAPDGWRSGADPAPVRVDLDRPVWVDPQRGTVDDGSQVHRAATLAAGSDQLLLDLDDRRVRAAVNATRTFVEVAHHGQRFVFERPDAFADHAVRAGDGTILAPMPGTVLAVEVAEGDRVAADQALGMMEAMKMELTLRAPHAGTVTEVEASPGRRVDLGERLFVVVPDEDPA